jgi:cytochrome b involved in lipid metabolism
MNDTTLPIKGGKRPPQQQPRNKQGGLRPGFGLHDWIQLLRSAKDLSQRRGAPIRRNITLSEVQQHNKSYDGWIILRGKVYNIAPYLPYHPGGSAILEKCLGKDATALFDKYHSWVNLDNLIGPLLLGYVMIEKKSDYDSDDDEDDGGYLKGTNSDLGHTTVGGSNNIVLPSASNAASSSSSNKVENAQELEFAMPKPRPTKGSVISSLLVSNGNNDDDQEEENEEQLL